MDCQGGFFPDPHLYFIYWTCFNLLQQMGILTVPYHSNRSCLYCCSNFQRMKNMSRLSRMVSSFFEFFWAAPSANLRLHFLRLFGFPQYADPTRPGRWKWAWEVVFGKFAELPIPKIHLCGLSQMPDERTVLKHLVMLHKNSSLARLLSWWIWQLLFAEVIVWLFHSSAKTCWR